MNVGRISLRANGVKEPPVYYIYSVMGYMTVSALQFLHYVQHCLRYFKYVLHFT